MHSNREKIITFDDLWDAIHDLKQLLLKHGEDLRWQIDERQL